jgi:hypothetical protein
MREIEWMDGGARLKTVFPLSQVNYAPWRGVVLSVHSCNPVPELKRVIEMIKTPSAFFLRLGRMPGA